MGSDVLTVNFSESVYSDLNQTGNLFIGDFNLTDSDNSRTINGVSHVAGDDSATVTLDLALDSTNDIGTDTLAAASATSIYDASNLPMNITPVVISDASAGDTDPPTLSNQAPANGTIGINVFSNLTFTISDSGSEVDWNTFEIQLTGDKGYSQLYTDEDFTIVSKTGLPASFDVTLNPDVDFGELEGIDVTVRADDFNGNSLVSPAWSFTTDVAAAPQVLTLHPSGVSHAGAFTTAGGTGWSDVLDSNDGLTSHAHKCSGAGYPTSATNSHFIVDIDDSGLSGENIQSIKIGVVTKYAPSCPTSGTTTGLMDICYKTGTATSCTTDISVSGDFSTYTTNHTVDSNGGSLDVTDIDNIVIEVRRRNGDSIHLIVTEVNVDVTYLP